MKRNLTFEKISGIWYIKLNNYPGPKEDLEMVSGSDTLLDNIVSAGSKKPIKGDVEVSFDVYTSNEPSEPNVAFYIAYKKLNDCAGAEYKLIKEDEIIDAVDMFWICPVTLHVLGEYPNYIYINHGSKRLRFNPENREG